MLRLALFALTLQRYATGVQVQLREESQWLSRARGSAEPVETRGADGKIRFSHTAQSVLDSIKECPNVERDVLGVQVCALASDAKHHKGPKFTQAGKVCWEDFDKLAEIEKRAPSTCKEGSNRVLVAVLASTRAERLSFESMKKNLLEPLNADLVLAIGGGQRTDKSKGGTGEMEKHAKYIFDMPDPEENDFGPLFEEVAKQCHDGRTFNRSVLGHKGAVLGGVKGSNHKTFAGGLMWYRFFLLQNLMKAGLMDKYDTLIITRSDHYYVAPHPPVPCLRADEIMTARGEQYGGLNDRHLVLSMKAAPQLLGMMNLVTSDPEKNKDFTWVFPYEKHMELVYYRYLMYLGVRLAHFDRVMYTVADPKDTAASTFLPTHDIDPITGGGMKYPQENKLALEDFEYLKKQHPGESIWKDWKPDFLPCCGYKGRELPDYQRRYSR